MQGMDWGMREHVEIMDRSKRYTDYNSYLRGLFGERVQKIAVDAGLTCPNRDGTLSKQGCIYCNAKGSGTGAFGRGMGIGEQIEAGKIPMMKKYKARKFLAYFQSFTNTYASVETMREMYDAAFSCKGVVGMAVGTRPDCVDEPKLDLIGSYAQKYLVWLEYGLKTSKDHLVSDLKAEERRIFLSNQIFEDIISQHRLLAVIADFHA